MKRILSMVISLFLAFAIPATAIPKEAASAAGGGENALSVSADFLGGMVLDQKISLMMRDGTYVEGKVFRSSPAAITMKVKSSDPKDRVRGPEATISTSDISVVYLRKNGAIAAPIAMGVLGGFAGGIAASYAAQDMCSVAGAMSIALLGVAGGASGGAIVGREAAKKTVLINVTQPVQGGSGHDDRKF